MSFEPLAWIESTLTPVHGIVWAVLILFFIFANSDAEDRLAMPMRITGGFIILPMIYCAMAVVIGQIFGDTYSWSQLWPTGIALGAGAGMIFLVFGLAAALDGGGLIVAIFFTAASLFATAVFGLFFSFFWWAIPRVVGLAPIDFPKFSWAVQL